MDIKLNCQEYIAALKNISSAENGTVTTLDNIPETECQSAVLEAYISRLNSIYSLLQQYKQLVKKDVFALQEVYESYYQWDISTGSRFSSRNRG